MAEPDGDAVAIIGMGGLFPGARTMEAFWQNIRNGFDAITDVPDGRWDPVFFDPNAPAADRFYCRRGGFVDDVATFDPTAFGIMPLAVEGAEPDQLLALAAAAAALADAGDAHHRVAPERIGVIIGRGGYLNAGVARLDQRVRGAQQLVESLRSLMPDLDDEVLRHVKEDFQSRLGPERPEASIGLVPNLAASRIANRLDFQGPAFTVDAACASALIAVDRGMNELQSKRCDLMVVGGVHHCHDLTLWSVFTQLNALSASQEIRPFSTSADGILVGEGTGLFVLKRLDDAERDNDRIYAVVRGSGVASDGRDASLMSPRPQGQVLAVEQAWQASGLDPSTVGLIEAHGTATKAGDTAELETLRMVFGKSNGSGPQPGLGSVKSMIGHAMPAAGAAGLAKAALAVFHAELPPTLHVGEPNPSVADTRFRLIEATEPWDSTGPRRAGINAFGFGGINAHVVIEEHASARDTASAVPAKSLAVEPDDEITLRIAGHDAAAILAHLDTWMESNERRSAMLGVGPARLAIVDPTSKRLALARKVLERGTPFRGRNDVWFESVGLVHSGGKVAFLFPGVEPEFDPHLDDVATRFSLPGWPLGDLGPRLQSQSLGIIAVGRMLSDVLESMGVTPDLIAGHSLGEWTGQIVSGMIPATYIDPFLSSMNPGSIEVSDVVFLALGCGIDGATALIDDLEDVYVSHDNCTHQSVVCGRAEVIEVVVERAKERRILAQEMPFRSGFHSPLFEPFIEGLASQFESMPLVEPRVPLWSATTCSPYPSSPEGVADVARRHLVSPVRFRELTEALYDEGVRVFIQVGPGSLGAFVDDCLGDRAYLVVQTQRPRQTGIGQLRRVAAALWVEGVEVDPSHLETTEEATASEQPVTVRLGSPLPMGAPLVYGLNPLALRSDGPKALDSEAPPASPGAVADFKLALDEVTEAARQVIEAASTRSRSSAPRQQAATVQTATAPTPVDQAGVPDIGTEQTVTRELSVDVEPAWLDHAFFPQAPDWPHPEDRFPLVPMTGILEMFMDAARTLVPGQLAIAVEQVRAFQWLAVDPPVEVTIRASIVTVEPGGDILVATSIDRHASAIVRLAPDYPETPPPSARPLHGSVEIQTDVDRVYAEGHLFHGPEYQGLVSFDEFAQDGARGRLISKPAPGALLDNAGQVFGYWVACAVDTDQLVLPTSIDRLSFFSPHPDPGVEVDCIVNVTELGQQTVRCDIELTVNGVVWCRIDGWEDRRFQTDDRLFRMLRNPSRAAIAQPQPGGWVLVDEAWPDSATRDVVRRRYLGHDERADYERRNPNAQRARILGRIAAKDAARLLLWDHGEGEIFPAEITVDNLESGQPVLRHAFDFPLHVSIAHSRSRGVAIVSPDRPVGIDIEVIEARTDQFERTSFTASELAHLAGRTGHDRDLEVTRMWAAKEAAAKASGSGLQGRLHDWECTVITPDEIRVGDQLIATTIIGTSTDGPENKEHIVAWTIIDN